MTPSVTNTDILQDIVSLGDQPQVQVNEPAKAEAPAVETPAAEAPKVETPAVETPVAEAPKAEEPKVETPKVEPAPIIDIAKILEEQSGGRIKSVEELNNILKENTELSDKVKSAPVLGDYAVKMDSWIKKGYEPELFHLVHDLPIDEMSIEDKVKTGLKLQNPDWTAEDVDLYVKETYGLLAPEEDGYNESKVKVGQLRMKQDSRAYENELRQLQNLTAYSNEDEQLQKNAELQRVDQWKQNLPKIINDFTKVSLPLNEKENFDFIVRPEQKIAIINRIQQAVNNAPVAFDEHGIKLVSDLIRSEFLNQNINEITKAIANKIQSSVVEKKIQETHNPSGLPKQEIPVADTDPDTQIFEAFGKLYGDGRRI